MSLDQPITDLATLMRSMDPVLDPRRFLFVTAKDVGAAAPYLADALMIFREAEGLTLILEAETAVESGLQFAFSCRMITLNVHSDLEAVGFLAALLPRLAEAGMGVNPVSAFHHDHLFVPAERAEDALAVLREIATAG